MTCEKWERVNYCYLNPVHLVVVALTVVFQYYLTQVNTETDRDLNACTKRTHCHHSSYHPLYSDTHTHTHTFTHTHTPVQDPVYPVQCRAWWSPFLCPLSSVSRHWDTWSPHPSPPHWLFCSSRKQIQQHYRYFFTEKTKTVLGQTFFLLSVSQLLRKDYFSCTCMTHTLHTAT